MKRFKGAYELIRAIECIQSKTEGTSTIAAELHDSIGELCSYGEVPPIAKHCLKLCSVLLNYAVDADRQLNALCGATEVVKFTED